MGSALEAWIGGMGSLGWGCMSDSGMAGKARDDCGPGKGRRMSE